MDELNHMKLQNKKGITDVIFLVVLLFVSAIVIVAGVFISTSIRNSMAPVLTQLDPTNASTNALNSSMGVISNTGDTIFMIILFCLIIGLCITSFMVYTHPIFLVIYIILSLVSLVLSAILSNSYESMTSGSLTATATPMLNWVMLNLPLVVLGIIIISIIIIYVKSRSAQAGGTL